MDGLADPTMWIIVFIVSLLGVVTKYAYYKVGKLGKDSALEHIPRITPEQWDRMEATYQNRGSLMLLFAGIPVIGSGLAAAAGAFETRLGLFVILVMISNLIRNWLLVFVFGQALTVLPFSS